MEAFSLMERKFQVLNALLLNFLPFLYFNSDFFCGNRPGKNVAHVPEIYFFLKNIAYVSVISMNIYELLA
jgi:hypothetical protein